jgi:transcription elongation factor GreA
MAEAISAGDASAHFLNAMEPEKARDERPEIERFVDWAGIDRRMADLSGDEIDAYLRERFPDVFAGGANGADDEGGEIELDDESAGQIEPLRAFLAYASRLAFTEENLVPHLRLGDRAGGARGGAGAAAELGGRAYYVTLEGLASLEQELEDLKARRPEIAEELRAAMADKDFRENAPLDAARDQQAHLEARIRAIEDQLRHAVIIDPETKGGRANVGSTVKVLNLEHDREQTFQLVSPSEVDPSGGKISVESPVGNAVINHVPGDEVVVKAPAGAVRLRVLEVEG